MDRQWWGWTFPCRCGCEGGERREKKRREKKRREKKRRERQRERERREHGEETDIGETTRIKKEFFFRRRTKVDIQSPRSSLKILLGTPSTDK